MGRVELPLDRSTPSPRAIPTNGVRKGTHVRAKVDMSSFSIPSPQIQPPFYTVDTPPQNQQYFNRPKRSNDSSLNNSPFLSPGASSSLSASPNISIRTNSVASTSQTPRLVRSPSPVRLQRNPPSSHDVSSSILTGPAKVAPRPGHARVNSSQVSVIGGDSSISRGHARTQSSIPPFVNGNSNGRSRIDSANSPYMARSRSPSPSEAKSERRISISSTASSALSATSRQPATVPIARGQRSVTVNNRPPLNTAFSSYNSATHSPTEAVSPSLPSSSIAATIAKLPPYREPSIGESSLQSPTSELGTQAQDAKKNRKILDLEITNKSLLAINSGLEVVKLQQAREIRELKRRLREGRTPDTTASFEDDEDDSGDFEGDNESHTTEEEGILDLELEKAHARCKSMVDAMVNQARESILYKYEMDPKHKGTNRVLHPAEIEMMQGQEMIERTPSVSPLPDATSDEAH
jgi:hypothetical protein